jgi:hypothetical protein
MKTIVRVIALAFLVASLLLPALNVLPSDAVTIIGDLNTDGMVDMTDILIAVNAFMARPGSPNWVLQADLNGDGVVNIRDIATVAKHFGQIIPKPLVLRCHIFPDALNLRSRGRWILVVIRLSEGYTVKDVNVSTIRLNGTVKAEAVFGCAFRCIGDNSTRLVLKFDRQSVIDLIKEHGEITGKFGKATLTIAGEFNDGATFEASDTIKIIRAACDGRDHPKCRC